MQHALAFWPRWAVSRDRQFTSKRDYGKNSFFEQERASADAKPSLTLRICAIEGTDTKVTRTVVIRICSNVTHCRASLEHVRRTKRIRVCHTFDILPWFQLAVLFPVIRLMCPAHLFRSTFLLSSSALRRQIHSQDCGRPHPMDAAICTTSRGQPLRSQWIQNVGSTARVRPGPQSKDYLRAYGAAH
jgi:hypothetical protein